MTPEQIAKLIRATLYIEFILTPKRIEQLTINITVNRDNGA